MILMHTSDFKNKNYSLAKEITILFAFPNELFAQNNCLLKD